MQRGESLWLPTKRVPSFVIVHSVQRILATYITRPGMGTLQVGSRLVFCLDTETYGLYMEFFPETLGKVANILYSYLLAISLIERLLDLSITDALSNR